MDISEGMIAWYRFDDGAAVGRDSSGNGNDASACGTNPPVIKEVFGRKAVCIDGGGTFGGSYLKLPKDMFMDVGDNDGISVAFWMNLGKADNVWERIFDFGKSEKGPYFFLTRNLRASCFLGSDLLADPCRSFEEGVWTHVAVVARATKGGALGSAGPVVYVDGVLTADGSISQTSSGNYKLLREWFDTFSKEGSYVENYIGHSQFSADSDLNAAIADFRIYKRALSEDEVVSLVCECLSEDEIVDMVCDRYLEAPDNIIADDLRLPASYMGGRAAVIWRSKDEEALSSDGHIGHIDEPRYVGLSATVAAGGASRSVDFYVNVIPRHIAPYGMTIHADREGADVSDVLYGLFYEDINNAADGGIYAELVSNRSFEAFEYNVYDASSGADGRSRGRRHEPLKYWFGDIDRVAVKNKGGLNEHLGIERPDVNEYYVTVSDGASIYNRGFCDGNEKLSMYVKEGVEYNFSIWAKAEGEGGAWIEASLVDEGGCAVSAKAAVFVKSREWKKYGGDPIIAIKASRTGYAQLKISFKGDASIDMVSLMPADVWGADVEERSETAHENYLSNPNYRLRRDLVEAMMDLHPSFLRFPGGCISEGSYIWENVYDWKDSVGCVERRKENYNVWGYMMTLGLGYMEYFQLAEDLGAMPLPVMACGVLCQARSDYVNPAGADLREKYIGNFIDLIDFAISDDFENNEWAMLRRSMGHEKPFPLHFLGVGNENWGEEFYACFEAFKHAIDTHMEEKYPGYDLTVISTVGAQADDDAYKNGWSFLSGNLKGGKAVMEFTDGEKSFEDEAVWYEHENDYMETIADEHYYRSNEYLLENADRYNYYFRAYGADGALDEDATSKVFVGEYASTDKNTLAGAIAEAAVMTGFENNSDVVRLASMAPLFNKTLSDGAYRWTPDLIWFDGDLSWRTPSYFVQQMFAGNIGKKALETSFTFYEKGEKTLLRPRGGIEIAAGGSEILLKEVRVVSNRDGEALFSQNFTGGNPDMSAWRTMSDAIGYEARADGLVLLPGADGLNGIYMENDEWSDYTLEVKAARMGGGDGFYIGVGLTQMEERDKKDVLEYVVGLGGSVTGLRVFKRGLEGYRMGDYSSSEAAGNLRGCGYEEIKDGVVYTFRVNYGGKDGRHISCSYSGGGFCSRTLEYKLEPYNRHIYNSATKDGSHIYVKLVNASDMPRRLDIAVDGCGGRAGDAKMTVLTADRSLVHKANVNTKGDERVKPVTSVIKVEDEGFRVSLPANSVSVFVFDVNVVK